MLSFILPNNNKPDVLQMVNAIEMYYQDCQIIVSNDSLGYGKGWAIRQGIEQASGDVIVFIDSDMDIHPGEVEGLLPYLSYYDVVVGIKDLRLLPVRRKIISFGYRLLVRLLFNLHISDTQTGLKIWKRSTLPTFETNGFAYDIEMLVKAHRDNLRIKEVPIKCRIYNNVKIKSIFRTLGETLRIWKKIRLSA